MSKHSTTDSKSSFATMLAMRFHVMNWLDGKPASSIAAIAKGIGATIESTAAVVNGLYADNKISPYQTEPETLYFIGEDSGFPTSSIPVSPPNVEQPAIVASGSTTAKQQLIDMDAANLKMPDESVETIEIKAVPDRRAPVKLDVDVNDLEIGIFSDGSMDLLIYNGLDDAHLKFTAAAVTKIRCFLGSLQEVV